MEVELELAITAAVSVGVAVGTATATVAVMKRRIAEVFTRQATMEQLCKARGGTCTEVFESINKAIKSLEITTARMDVMKTSVHDLEINAARVDQRLVDVIERIDKRFDDFVTAFDKRLDNLLSALESLKLLNDSLSKVKNRG